MIAVDPRLAGRLSLRRLWSESGLELVETSWRRQRHPASSEGSTSYAAIEILRAGTFEKRCRRARVLADPLTIVFYNPGEAFEIRHPVGLGNDGWTIRIAPAALRALVRARGVREERGPFPRATAPAPAAFVLAIHRSVARLEAADALDPLAREEAVLELVDRALELGTASPPPDAPDVARRRARDVRAFLNESFAEPLRLADVSAACGCSLWHVSRQFRQATGTSIHAYLIRLRLGHAVEALHQGAQDLSSLALGLGFGSHSHFTSAFHAEFGITPRAARAALRRRRAHSGRLLTRAVPSSSNSTTISFGEQHTGQSST